MKKKFITITMILLMIMSISGCSSSNKPEKTVTEFVEAIKQFDFELIEKKINPKNEESKKDISELYKTKEESLENYFVEHMQSNAKKISYEIKDTKEDGDKATVTVNFKYVDGAPLFRATLREYMKEAFALAFTNPNISDEENEKIFIEIMKEQEKSIKETFTEKTVDVKCVKVDDEWYIDEINDDLLNVATSNLMLVAEEMEDSFNLEGDNEESTMKDYLESDEVNVIERNIEDEIELATLNFKVTKVQETQTLTSQYGSPVVAKEGTKFILVNMDITNTTKSQLQAPDDFTLIDNEDREFRPYSDSIGAVDDYLNYRDLAPSIKETGRYVYEVPNDTINYYIVMGKSETDDVYKVNLTNK